MSSQEARNEIIRDNLPKLIKEITGFTDENENTRRCQQFAWSIIRNHRNLSTNSHEVRRKIEGIKERFTVDNYADYANYLGVLCDEIIHHPLCVEHYEVDVHWSLLDFLLTLAFNPTGAIRRNKQKIDLSQRCHDLAKNELEEITEAEYWKTKLKEDFIPVGKLSASDSELSDWSDDLESQTNSSSGSCEKQAACYENVKKSISILQNIKAPEKDKSFILFESERPAEYLFDNVQHSWWLQSSKRSQVVVDSQRTEANFAVVYNRFLSESSNNLVRCEEPATATEQCLLRELLWMFHSPLKCKFFTTSNNGIAMRFNVTLPSTTVNGFVSFVEQHFFSHIRMMHALRKFLESTYACDDFTPPKTLECYAANLKALLEPISQKLIECEKHISAQRDCEINTLLSLKSDLQSTLSQLEYLYDVHRQVVLNLRQYPAHISSAFLLSGLMGCNQTASNHTEANLAMALFLTSIKSFCVIIDTWWTEGRLDDWLQEFLVERVSSDKQNVCVRQYSKNKETAFFVPTNVAKRITEDGFFKLLLEHSLEAGRTLSLLYEINRISDLRNACDAIEGKLYNVFIDDIMTYVNKLQAELGCDTTNSHATNGNGDTVDSSDATADASSGYHKHLPDNLATSDEFLLLAFSSELMCKDECDAPHVQEREMDALGIFRCFEKTKHILPLREVVLSSLARILRARIALANSFVMRLYRDEFVVLKHLRNIRKIMLLEASDLMHQFYGKLFKQIEYGGAWANSFLLTVQLDDIICSKFPDMSSLFRLEINSTFRCQTNKVFEAVDELTVTYNFSRELSHIISQQDINEYNKVFRFLLKVKWGIATLENLQFPRSHKRRVPYAPLEMIDLLMRRLEQLRFWMIYAIHSIHFHLMTHVLQSMGEQLDEKIVKCTNLKEMETVHRSYVSTVCEHCFLGDSFNAIKLGVEQLLNLVFILRLEWKSCVNFIESSGPLSVECPENTDNDYVTNSQIDAIELTYIRCHQYLANKLNNEVYLQQKTFLSGLSAAFNTSLPY